MDCLSSFLLCRSHWCTIVEAAVLFWCCRCLLEESGFCRRLTNTTGSVVFGVIATVVFLLTLVTWIFLFLSLCKFSSVISSRLMTGNLLDIPLIACLSVHLKNILYSILWFAGAIFSNWPEHSKQSASYCREMVLICTWFWNDKFLWTVSKVHMLLEWQCWYHTVDFAVAYSCIYCYGELKQ